MADDGEERLVRDGLWSYRDHPGRVYRLRPVAADDDPRITSSVATLVLVQRFPTFGDIGHKGCEGEGLFELYESLADDEQEAFAHELFDVVQFNEVADAGAAFARAMARLGRSPQ